MNEGCEKFSNSKSSASGCCLAFAKFFPSLSLDLLIKVLLIKKSVFFLRSLRNKSWKGCSCRHKSKKCQYFEKMTPLAQQMTSQISHVVKLHTKVDLPSFSDTPFLTVIAKSCNVVTCFLSLITHQRVLCMSYTNQIS